MWLAKKSSSNDPDTRIREIKMETKTHFIVTFVSLIFLGVIVVKPDALSRNEDRSCKIEKGRMDCQSTVVGHQIVGETFHKLSENEIK